MDSYADADSTADSSMIMLSRREINSFNSDVNSSSSLSNQTTVQWMTMYANILRIESAAIDVEKHRRNRRQQRMDRENRATSKARDLVRKMKRENEHRNERIRKARDDLQVYYLLLFYCLKNALIFNAKGEVVKRKDRIAGRIDERKRRRCLLKENLLRTDRWILRATAIAVAAAIAQGIRGHSLHNLRIKSLMDFSLIVARFS